MALVKDIPLGWLARFHKLSKIVFWALVGITIWQVIVLSLFFANSRNGFALKFITTSPVMLLEALPLLLRGLILVGIAEFLRYALEPDYRPGAILRRLWLLSAATAVCEAIYWILGVVLFILNCPTLPGESTLRIVLASPLFQFPGTLAYILFCVTLALAARWLLPLISEAKTLV